MSLPNKPARHTQTINAQPQIKEEEMMTSTENFDRMVAADQRLQSRWDAVADKLEADLHAAGFTLQDKNVLKEVAGVRLAILTDLGLQNDYMAEILRHPAFVQQAEAKTRAERLAAGDDAALEEVNRLPAQQRLTIGRSMQAAEKEAQKASKQNDAPDARTIQWILSLPAAARMSAARSAGIRV